jgi:hypothetical protein
VYRQYLRQVPINCPQSPPDRKICSHCVFALARLGVPKRTSCIFNCGLTVLSVRRKVKNPVPGQSPISRARENIADRDLPAGFLRYLFIVYAAQTLPTVPTALSWLWFLLRHASPPGLSTISTATAPSSGRVVGYLSSWLDIWSCERRAGKPIVVRIGQVRVNAKKRKSSWSDQNIDANVLFSHRNSYRK